MAIPDDSDDLSTHGSMQGLLEALARAPQELLVRGTVVDDQYRIDRVIGEGAMGIVYQARDLRLERDVAIKLAREASPHALAQSTREALALARLSHPNVVVVYSVGEVVERLYVAMEYIDGATARVWCTGKKPRDIIELYIRAGEGLAAAHAVGLVHRDFKPDNVLVGKDGRARVADFGLARDPVASVPVGRATTTEDAEAEAAAQSARAVASMAARRIASARGDDATGDGGGERGDDRGAGLAAASPRGADGVLLTPVPSPSVAAPPNVSNVGTDPTMQASPSSASAKSSDLATAFVGTRAYMPPEQYRGETIGPAADQFAFCVSLWEALHGVRPFDSIGDVFDGRVAAGKLVALIESERVNRATAADRARRVPRHVEAALRRGMAADPAQRWPDMAALIAELRRDPRRTRRRVMAAAGTAVVLGGGALALAMAMRAPAAPDPCSGGPARIAKRWSSGAAVRGLLGAKETAMLDDWAGRWGTEYRAVCEAAAWTPQLRERGMGCLSTGEHVLDATLGALGERLGEGDQRRAIAELPRPEACADPAYLASVVAPPSDPALAARVETMHTQLAEARILAEVGKGDRAKALLAPLAEHPVPYPAAIAELHYSATFIAFHTGGQLADLLKPYEDAYFEARAVGQREIALRSASELAGALLDVSKDDDAARWGRLAEVEALGVPDEELQAEAWISLATLANDRSDPDTGLERAEKAVAVGRRAKHDAENILAPALRARAGAYDGMGKHELARADMEEATRLIRTKSGDFDPRLVELETELALVLVHLDKNDEAVAAGRRALAIADKLGGEEYQGVALGGLGMALSHAHQVDEALAMLDRSLAIDRKQKDRSYNVASDLNNRADLLTQLKRYDEAIADGKQAIAIWSGTIGADASEVGAASFNVAMALQRQGKLREARAMTERAIAIIGKQPDSPAMGQVLVMHAYIAYDLGDKATAMTDVDRAIAQLTKVAPGSSWLESAHKAKTEFTGGKADR